MLNHAILCVSAVYMVHDIYDEIYSWFDSDVHITRATVYLAHLVYIASIAPCCFWSRDFQQIRCVEKCSLNSIMHT